MHKNKIILDSCVFNKLFLEEHDSEQAVDLISALAQKNYRVLAPGLFLYEVLSIAKINNFPTVEAYDLIIDFQLTLIELDDACIRRAIAICETGHQKSGFPSFYDASYHALAMQHNCYFVTADQRHFTKTKQLGHILLLSDWEKVL